MLRITKAMLRKQANFLKNLYPPPYSEVITTQSATVLNVQNQALIKIYIPIKFHKNLREKYKDMALGEQKWSFYQ